MKTTFPKHNCHKPNWYIIDATGKTLGRLSTEISNLLRGKKNSYFYPTVNQGNFVLVINAEKIVTTGKKEEQKNYYNSTQRPGSLKQFSYSELKKNYPNRIIERSVSRMLPKSIFGKQYMKRLFLYANSQILYKQKI